MKFEENISTKKVEESISINKNRCLGKFGMSCVKLRVWGVGFRNFEGFNLVLLAKL